MVASELNIGWNFSNSYSEFSETMFTRVSPLPALNPSLSIFNEELSIELGLNFSNLNEKKMAEIFSGNSLPAGSDPIAQAYAGHQFGHFTILGDGRATVLGEHITPNKDKVDIQYKGSGKTPYSRGADGRAVLGPMLREYLISEAMYGLGIPTTRSLAVVETGEHVFRESRLPGAVLTRVAKSHIRVGTFQYLASRGDLENLKKLVSYSIDRHYPHLKNEENLPLALLNEVMSQQIDLICHWMRVGFIHGVMNTDNVTISGETIDYGPCAFMDHYDEKTCFSSIDIQGRYAFGNQPVITQWNLARFAESLLPLIHSDQKKSIKAAEDSISSFKDSYEKKWLKMMKSKIGISEQEDDGDYALIQNLLKWMQSNKADYTNTFCYIMNENINDIEVYKNADFIDWCKIWKDRLKENTKSPEDIIKSMRRANPTIIPRNHIVEEALQDAESKKDFTRLKNLVKLLKYPYSSHKGITSFQTPSGKEYKTFCGT